MDITELLFNHSPQAGEIQIYMTKLPIRIKNEKRRLAVPISENHYQIIEKIAEENDVFPVEVCRAIIEKYCNDLKS